jgi:hypothetical protein
MDNTVNGSWLSIVHHPITPKHEMNMRYNLLPIP